MPDLRASLKGLLRRQSDLLFPNHETRQYRRWIARRVKQRALIYDKPPVPGLLSILTPVWDGSPIRYLKALASALASQNQTGACEWVLLDNGCAKAPLLGCLRNLALHPWVKLHRLERNVGIIAGLRHCLERASSRYVLPVDADDLLYPDTLRIVAACIQEHSYPPLLYTDEDKVIGSRFYQPYMKPDWDPVLLLNSAYIAHLGILDRRKALDLGVYSDPNTEGSPDWDAFVRFLIAGYTACHVPEVLYSWRVHARSTADDAATKPYVHTSQRAVLQRFIDSRPDPQNFKLERSPLLAGLAHWHFSRAHRGPPPFTTVRMPAFSQPAKTILDLAARLAREECCVLLLGDGLRIDPGDWPAEALALFDLHPDTVMIGGRIRDDSGRITEAGRCFGYRGVCGCPDRGRSVSDPGYFGQMWKQRSVSAVSSQFAVVRASFLYDLLQALPETASLAFLGAWAGALALRSGKRVVYSPFLSGVSNSDWDRLINPAEQALFARIHGGLIPDRRFYSPSLSLERPFAFASPEIARQPQIPLAPARPV